MSLMAALERHVPLAGELLAGVEPLAYPDKKWEEQEVDFLCAFGASCALYEQMRPWLDAEGKRRLVFVEDRPEALAGLLDSDEAILLLNDRRVKLYFLETPLQSEPLAKKIAWSAVFLKMGLLDVSASPSFPFFRHVIEEAHRAADLLLSDGADGGCSLLRHAKENLARPFQLASGLSFPNIPAVIIGAGPSLEESSSCLAGLQNRALILAGGTALSKLSFPPHFGAAVDKEAPLQKISFPDVPLCFQARMHPENFQKMRGTALLVPEGHFPFLNWLVGQEAPFEGGWTVGTFLAALAVQWGCNPIVFVGMDYCYRGSQKYAQGEACAAAHLVEAVNERGEKVWTQRDWLMAIRWIEQLAQKHPDRSFFNATEGGLPFLSPVRLEDLSWPEIPDLQAKVRAAVRRLPRPSCAPRWAEWEESLKRCAQLCEAYLLNQEAADFEEEVAYEQLLGPLWQNWRPVFERELALDPHRIGQEQKMELNKVLFYQQVIQEHLDAL